MKIGIYLGDIKKPKSLGGLTFELTFVEELLKHKSGHEFVFYYFGAKGVFKDSENAHFVSLKYYRKPEFSFSPFCVKTYKTPIFSLNYILKRDKINVAYFLTPYLHEHIEIPYYALIRNVSHRVLPHFPEFSSNRIFEKMENKLNLFLKSASRIITGTTLAKNDIKTLYDVIDENIEVLPMPYPNWIEKVKEDRRILDLNSLNKNSYILYPTQYWTHRNHIRLILAAQILKEQNINLKIVFTGTDRGNKSYLMNKVKELSLSDDVCFGLPFVGGC